MNLKSFLSGAIVCLILFTGACFAEDVFFKLTKVDYPIVVSGTILKSDLPTLNYEGNTYIPLRKVGEATGAKVEWDAVSKRVEIIPQIKEVVKEKIVYITPTPKPTKIPTPTPTPVPIVPLELNKPYVAIDGLTVTLNSITISDSESSRKYQISYTLKNETPDKKINESTFRMFFKDGTNENQWGLFGSLFPGKSVNRQYTFEVLKSQEPTIFEYGAEFLSRTPQANTLKWNVK